MINLLEEYLSGANVSDDGENYHIIRYGQGMRGTNFSNGNRQKQKYLI